MPELKDKGVSLKFIKWFANNVAHHLAKYNYSITDHVWKANNAHPEFIDVIVKY